MNDNLEQARDGAERIDTMLAQKQLSVNYDKSKYLVMGSKKTKKLSEMRNRLQPNENGRGRTRTVGL